MTLAFIAAASCARRRASIVHHKRRYIAAYGKIAPANRRRRFAQKTGFGERR
jgi:hypothetical protein